MGFYEKNMMIIPSILGDAKIRVEKMEQLSYEGYARKDEYGCICIQRNGWEYPLTSRNQEEECRRLVREINFKKDNLYLVYGIANKQLLQYIVKNMTFESKLLIFEADIKVFKCCMSTADYTFLAKEKPKQCYIMMAEEFDQLLEKEMRIVNYLHMEKLLYNIQPIMLPNCYYKREFFHQCVVEIREIISSEVKKAGNSMSDMFEGLKNNYYNIRHFVECNKISEIEGKFKGYPGIIVSAGPSLEKNIQYLKDAYGKAVIFACDASVRACREIGVEPDVTASIERVYPTYEFFYKDKEFHPETVLIGPTVLWKDLLDDFKGKQIIIQKVDHGVDLLVGNNFPQVEHVDIGMSSANVAFSAAVLAGCDPIIFIGQDLAFTDDKLHSSIAHVEGEGGNDAARFDGTWAEGYDGGMVKTNDIFNWFRAWFEDKIVLDKTRTYINATEGGARIAGTQKMKFKDAVEKYCVKEKPYMLYHCLEDRIVEKEDYEKAYSDYRDNFQRDIDKMRKIQDTCKNYYNKIKRYHNDKLLRMNQKELGRVVEKLAEGTTIVQEISNDWAIYSYFAQLILQTMYHVKAIGNEITGENVKENIRLQMGLMDMIEGGCDTVIEQYEIAKAYVEEQIELL